MTMQWTTSYIKIWLVACYISLQVGQIFDMVHVCARCQADLKKIDLKVVKTTIRFVNGTMHHRIWYSQSSELQLVGYTDGDWAGNVDEKKNTSNECFYVGHNLVS